MGASAGYGSVAMVDKSQQLSRFSPELLVQLKALNDARMNNNLDSGTVTIEEMGQFPVEPKPDSEQKDDN